MALSNGDIIELKNEVYNIIKDNNLTEKIITNEEIKDALIECVKYIDEEIEVSILAKALINS